jgi:hypothetical protein
LLKVTAFIVDIPLMELDKIVEFFANLCETKVALSSKPQLTTEETMLLKWMDESLLNLGEYLIAPYIRLVQAYNKDCKQRGLEPNITIEGRYIGAGSTSTAACNEEEGLALGAGLAIGGIMSQITLSEAELEALGI